jgi:uncharacterized membrane protein YgcG
MVLGLAVLAGLKAQSVISAHSGVLHYYEGDVTVDGQVPHQKAGTFADVKQNQELATQAGRAEVLLTPGVFLRMGENSAVRMVNNKLTDTRVEFVKGSAIADFVEVVKDNQVTMAYQDYKVTFAKRGIYRFDSQPAEFKVYTGEAMVSRGTASVTLKDGRAVPFTPALIAEKFDNKTGDSLYRWAKRRSEYISVANLSAARQAGTGFNSSGTSGWYYNPYYSMFTFIPGRGYMCDPFATFMPAYSPMFMSLYQPMFGCYYSPMSAWNYFSRPYYNYGGGGYYGNRNGYTNASAHYPTSIGTSSAVASYSGSSSYSSGPSVGSGSSSASSGSSGFSGGGGSHGGGFSGGSGGGGGGGSHGGGSGGGHGK